MGATTASSSNTKRTAGITPAVLLCRAGLDPPSPDRRIACRRPFAFSHTHASRATVRAAQVANTAAVKNISRL